MKIKNDKFCNLEELYLGSYKLVYMFVADYTKERQIIEEISSIVWLKVTQNPKKYLEMDKQKLFNYLKIMVKTAYFDYYNNSKKEREKLNIFYESYFEEIVSSNRDEKIGAEDFKYLNKALHILSNAEKTLIKLRYNQGLNYKEISQITGASEGSLRTKQSRIYDKLKAEILRLKKESEC